ncbi:Unknown protein sequence [Pseudomonas amygdali pv. lachrymans]|uniref:Uncharacterized protein n=1 Tax=Pseudomonas amygdali pv. lachrymans TaxID=53707 RepID=A0A0P9TXU0_PSEAV|nr:Unknown protein sequence [Pseudomonas amygdali pv. lachrymans]
MATGRIQRVVGEAGHADQAFGFDRGQAKALIEQRFAYRHGNGQVVRGDHRAKNAGIRRWQFRINLRHRAAGHQERDALIERAEQALEIFAVGSQHVERDQHACGRTRVDDAGLMQAMKVVVVLGLFTVRCFGDLRRRCGQYVAAQAAASQRGTGSTETHQDTATLY